MSRKANRAVSGRQTKGIQRPPAEQLYAAQLSALSSADEGSCPPGWRLSARAVRSFILGRDDPLVDPQSGQPIPITRKFFGDDPLVERAIVTAASHRGLMLVGEPGTAKSMLSELLAAAMCGTSRLTIQGSSAVTEDHIRYSWNYAMLLADGPSERALVPGPLHVAMNTGRICRFEEITRCPVEVQDVLVAVLSERSMLIPELGEEGGVLLAVEGFNVIATANTRDRGVNEMSSALRRRFNFETVRPIADLAEECELVDQEVTRQLAGLGSQAEFPPDVLELLVTTFHELRCGRDAEGVSVRPPASPLSTAEAVAVGIQASLHARHFGSGRVQPLDVARHLPGSLDPDAEQDRQALRSYFDVTVRRRAQEGKSTWQAYFAARDCLD